MSTNSEEKNLLDIKKIVIDFTRDILVTFPEQKELLHPDLKQLMDTSAVDSTAYTNALHAVFSHCKKVYPEKFFDILYQNNEVFSNSIEFLPGIDFSLLWIDKDLSDKTRETIWKYLQLLLFTLVSSISDETSFGDTASIFEAIDENEFKKKLEETIDQMKHVFAKTEKDEHENGNESENANTIPNINIADLPDPTDIHEHVTGMMNGKLGKLAREIAEETAAELNMDMENASSVNDVFKTLFKNPTKLMSLVKNVGSKLDNKLKSGDMKESELLQEASDIMKKMKSMPGMGDLQSMLSKMGMGNMMPGGSGGKVNVNAMKSKLDQNLKAAKNKERLLAELDKRKQAQQTNLQSFGLDSTGRECLVFSKGEQVERSIKATANVAATAEDTPTDSSKTANAAKKNKNKKKNKKKNTNATNVNIQ